MDALLDIRLAKRIYVGDRKVTIQQHVELQRRFATFYAGAQRRAVCVCVCVDAAPENRDDPEVDALRRDVHSYRVSVEGLGLQDWMLTDRFKDAKQVQALIRSKVSTIRAFLPPPLTGAQALRSVLFLPLVLVGVVLNALPVFLSRRANRGPYVEEKAQQKVFVIAFALPLWVSLSCCSCKQGQ